MQLTLLIVVALQQDRGEVSIATAYAAHQKKCVVVTVLHCSARNAKRKVVAVAVATVSTSTVSVATASATT
eukprot:1033545-Ditylum_brightwellii.AAC.1